MIAIQHILNFLTTLTPSKVYNSLILRLSYWLSVILKKHIHWGKPEYLSIEPSNFCNLSCSMCPLGTENKKSTKQFISPELYKSIISHTHKWLVNVQLYFQGEPFLHPHLPELIKYTTDKNVFTTISTNGHYLTEKICDEIIDAGLKILIISVDGTTQEVYGKYRIGGSIAKVKDGINNIVNAKKKKGTSYPEVVIQFVLFKFNEHQVYEMKSFVKETGADRLQLKTAQIDDVNNNYNLIPEEKKYSRYSYSEGRIILNRQARFYCKRIWFGSVITSYGKIVPCCFDKNANHSLGNVYEKSVIELFKNNASREFKKRVWASYNEITMCRNCSEGVKNIILK